MLITVSATSTKLMIIHDMQKDIRSNGSVRFCEGLNSRPYVVVFGACWRLISDDTKKNGVIGFAADHPTHPYS